MPEDKALKIGVVIVAAGRGERAAASTEGPKQYRRIGGRPVIAHTLDRFATWGGAVETVCVIHADDRSYFDKALAETRNAATPRIVTGAATRQGSVLNGLRALAGTGATHVMIHDGVRAFFGIV